MLTNQQFTNARNFILRHGRLLDRFRFLHHFENADSQSVLNALQPYQNPDGGFAHGLELDITCPQSSGICTEVALGLLLELNVRDHQMLDKAENWIISNQTPDGRTLHPTDDQIEAYPHGPWWKGGDPTRVFALAGLLARLNRGNDTFFQRTADLFAKTQLPLKQKLAIYDYPLHLYLHFAPGREQFTDALTQLKTAFPKLLDTDAWHAPLFYCHDRWYSDDIDKATWKTEAEKAIAMLADDGGVFIEQYANLPWWRPAWTTDLLIILKARELL